jgi:hypothetical protein
VAPKVTRWWEGIPSCVRSGGTAGDAVVGGHPLLPEEGWHRKVTGWWEESSPPEVFADVREYAIGILHDLPIFEA